MSGWVGRVGWHTADGLPPRSSPSTARHSACQGKFTSQKTTHCAMPLTCWSGSVFEWLNHWLHILWMNTKHLRSWVLIVVLTKEWKIEWTVLLSYMVCSLFSVFPVLTFSWHPESPDIVWNKIVTETQMLLFWNFQIIFGCRIHTLGSANRSRNHPDSRAILFEDMTYR